MIFFGVTNTGNLSANCRKNIKTYISGLSGYGLEWYTDNIINKETPFIPENNPDTNPKLPTIDLIGTCPELVGIASITQFFMIATIGWMACEGIHLYYNVVAIFRIPKRRYLLKLATLGWFVPLLLVSMTLVVEKTSAAGYRLACEYCGPEMEGLPDSNVNFWVAVDVALFHVTITVPFTIMFIFNIIMFGMVISALANTQNTLYRTIQRLSNLSRGNSVRIDPVIKNTQRHKQLTNSRKQLQGSIGLLVLIGSTLIFNIFMINSEHTQHSIAYIFIILNASQGMYHFAVFTVCEKLFRNETSFLRTWCRPFLLVN